MKHPDQPNPWIGLRRFTNARIALGHTGVSLRTEPQLAFQLAHAQARDAVHRELDTVALAASLSPTFQCVTLHSAARDRSIYLQRPDLGRQLDDDSRVRLQQLRPADGQRPYDLAFVIADGLSSLAVAQHAAPFLGALMARIKTGTGAQDWSIAPLAIVQQGRVAAGDETGELLGAKCVLVLIGERPGLSSPDSMGLYLTWAPRAGLTDESRNCISNVRPAGLSYEAAAHKAHYLLCEARRRSLSGVQLKDETDGDALQVTSSANILLTDDK